MTLFNVLLFVIWCFGAWWIGKKFNLYTYPPLINLPRPTIGSVFKVFFIFFLIALFLFPLIFSFLYIGPSFIKGNFSLNERGWIQVWVLYTSFLFLILYEFFLDQKTARAIHFFNQSFSLKKLPQAAFVGFLGWFVSLPFIAVISILTDWVSYQIFGKKGGEQVAILQLEALKGEPYLFFFMAFAVAIAVPYIEELLFRGYLQSWFRRKLGRVLAILVTSLLFSFAHYSRAQGVGNFSLICSLFAVSCILGFVYEKAQNLFAPYVFHALFNTMTLIALISGRES